MEIYKSHLNGEEGNTIKSWCPNIDKERSVYVAGHRNLTAIEQMEKIALLPYVKYCAMMPDSHTGQNMPIGGVVACDNVVVPDFVGADIGCGMCAIKTNIHRSKVTEADLQCLFNLISQAIPVGFSHNTDKRRNTLLNLNKEAMEYIVDKSKVELGSNRLYNPIGYYRTVFFEQLGTLGGGNHFIEVQYDEGGFIWIMIHSGSRNMGKKIGDYFNEIAKEKNEQWYSDGRDIPFLPVNTDEGKGYVAWMNFALRFAFLSRRVMIEDAFRCFKEVFSDAKITTVELIGDTIDGIINIHHNFAILENHHGKNYWIHRKGTTRAFAGMTGIIPGSMGTASYIVKGLGNHNSLMSCSHGAGRKMGRMAFSRKMKDSHDQIEKSLDGVIHSDFSDFTRGKMKGIKDVSEAPAAYKDIKSVMRNQADLVSVVHELRPLVSIKG